MVGRFVQLLWLGLYWSAWKSTAADKRGRVPAAATMQHAGSSRQQQQAAAGAVPLMHTGISCMNSYVPSKVSMHHVVQAAVVRKLSKAAFYSSSSKRGQGVTDSGGLSNLFVPSLRSQNLRDSVLIRTVSGINCPLIAACWWTTSSCKIILSFHCSCGQT